MIGWLFSPATAALFAAQPDAPNLSQLKLRHSRYNGPPVSALRYDSGIGGRQVKQRRRPCEGGHFARCGRSPCCGRKVTVLNINRVSVKATAVGYPIRYAIGELTTLKVAGYCG